MPKMLVPPFRARLGDTRGCTGATMADGTVYRANPRGAMDVSDHHARAMKRDPAIAGDIIPAGSVARDDFAGRPGRYCTAGCSMTEYQPWSRACPRCGAPTEEGAAI